MVLSTQLDVEGYHVPKNMLSDSRLDMVRSALTMVPQNDFMRDMPADSPLHKRFLLYSETLDAIVVPKFFGLSEFGRPERDLLTGRGAEIDVPFVGTLRDPIQTAPLATFLAAARCPLRMGGIVSLPCGAGKTVVALKIASELRKKTLIIVHKEFLLSQWHERISEYMPSASIGLVKASVTDVAGRDVVLASLQSLSMKRYAPETFSDFGLVIIDECHRVGTEVFSRALSKTSFEYSLGLSATVERKDGMTKAIVYHIGDVIDILPPANNPNNTKHVCVKIHRFSSNADAYNREEVVRRKMPSGELKASPNLSKMINNICAFEPRTFFLVNIIIEGILQGCEANRKVLVLSDRKSQLTDIANEIASRRNDIGIGFYWGGMKPEALAVSAAQQIICATYPYAAEGMDIPGLDTLVLASPKTDVQQSCGRILRRVNEHAPLIVDLVDTSSHVFTAQSRKRMKFYRTQKFVINM
jgi:hypothetical protein